MTDERSKLRRWRDDAGFSLSEIRDLTGVSPAHWSRVERGLRQLAPNTKVVVARRLGVAVGDLFDVEPIDEAVA